MATIGVPLNIGQLPYTCYPSDPQTLYADMFNRARALYPDIKGVLIQPTAPSAGDSDKLWIKTSGGAPVGQFIRYNAQWVWPYEVPANSNERRIWVGTLVSLDTYDGGSAGAVGDASGPFWTEDAAFRDRIPIGVGPSLATVVATNYGDADAATVLTEAQLPEHRHFILSSDTSGYTLPTSVNRVQRYCNSSGDINTDYNLSGDTAEATLGLTSPIGANASLNFLNPTRGVYIIQRTGRIYRVG